MSFALGFIIKDVICRARLFRIMNNPDKETNLSWYSFFHERRMPIFYLTPHQDNIGINRKLMESRIEIRKNFSNPWWLRGDIELQRYANSVFLVMISNMYLAHYSFGHSPFFIVMRGYAVHLMSDLMINERKLFEPHSLLVTMVMIIRISVFLSVIRVIRIYPDIRLSGTSLKMGFSYDLMMWPWNFEVYIPDFFTFQESQTSANLCYIKLSSISLSSLSLPTFRYLVQLCHCSTASVANNWMKNW